MSFLLDLLFPPVCYVCGRFGYYFCPNCTRNLQIGKLSHLSSPHIEAHLSIFKDISIKKSISNLKYNFVTDFAPNLAKLSAYTIKANFPLIIDYWHQNNFGLLPVPLHHFRQNWRGFNQSSLIGQHLSKYLKLPFYPNLVTKTQPTSIQVKTSHKSLRLRNQQNTFSFNHSLDFSPLSRGEVRRTEGFKLPSNIIIFDDVYTTGATTISLAKIFPKNTSIWILSLV